MINFNRPLKKRKPSIKHFLTHYLIWDKLERPNLTYHHLYVQYNNKRMQRVGDVLEEKTLGGSIFHNRGKTFKSLEEAKEYEVKCVRKVIIGVINMYKHYSYICKTGAINRFEEEA